MDRKIDVVLEGHLSLDYKIDRNHEEAKELNWGTNLKLDLISKTLANKIDQNREKIDQVDQKVEINREAIETNRQEIVGNRKKIEVVDNKLSAGLKK